MRKIIIDGFTFTYDVVKNYKQKYKIIIRVKDKQIVLVSINDDISINEIENILSKRLDFIKERLPKTNNENIIHVNGVGYRPHFIVGGIPFVRIYGDEIILCALSRDAKEYRKLLNEFYEDIIKEELSKIINTAYYDFKEIKFPTISIEYFVGRFGDYDTRTNHIRLSSILAKYDSKHIKLTLYHELCHTFVPNHSKAFYEIFESKYPNAKNDDLSTRKLHYFDCL